MNYGAADATVTWGWDFWQKVLISGLGTGGSLLVALALLWLNRRLGVREERKREQTELHWRLAEKMSAYRDFVVSPRMSFEAPAAEISMNFMFALKEFEIRIKDSAVSDFCGEYGRAMWNLWVRDGLLPISMTSVGVLPITAIEATQALMDYLSKGMELPKLDVETFVLAPPADGVHEDLP